MTPGNEKGAFRKIWSDQLRIALVYPNSYRLGMSNLGFQHVYRLLNSSDRFVAERFFLEPPVESKTRPKSLPKLLSLESSRPLRDFHVIAFSLPFENDYLNAPLILNMGRVEPLSRNRSSSDPIVLAGGVSVSMNPEPLAAFMDLFHVGEIYDVEAPGGLFRLIAEIILEYGPGVDRDFLFESLKQCPGVYIPSAYEFVSDGKGLIDSITVLDGYPEKIKALKADWENCEMPRSVITSPDLEFSDTCLVEINRGCSRKCRFCAAGWIHSPVRYRRFEAITPIINEAMASGLRLGLVGSDLANHPQLQDIIAFILEGGGKFSLSSIRPEGMSEFMIDALLKTGQKTATLAPETATPRMKNVIGKRIPPETFYGIIARLVEAGIPNIRLYFMIGLPVEKDDDVQEIVDFALECRSIFVEASRKRGRIGVLSIQVNPFIPKPWTPFQWSALIGKDSLERRIEILRKGLGKVSNLSLRIEYGRDFLMQALLSRADRNLGEALLGDTRPSKLTAQSLERAGVDVQRYVYRERGETEIFPWDIVDHGTDKKVLWKIYRDSLKS